jgi:hypothetical protein
MYAPTPPQSPTGTTQSFPQQGTVSGFAVTALVTGIVGLVLVWVPGLDLILGIIAATFGAIAAFHTTRRPDKRGWGLAIAGLTLGILTIVGFALILALVGAAQSG